MESVLNLSVILSIIGVLVVLTNIIVQVVKKVTWGKLPTNILAVTYPRKRLLTVHGAHWAITCVHKEKITLDKTLHGAGQRT